MSTPVRVLVLAVSGSALGIAVSALSPSGVGLWASVRPTAAADPASCVELPATVAVSVREALELHRAGRASFVDLRQADEFAQGHVEGAVHMPCRSASASADVDLPRGRAVVLYGDDRNAEWAAVALRNRGHADVRVMAEGFAAWRKMQGPAEAGTCAGCADHP